MNKNIAFLLLIITPLFINAQPVVSNAENFSIGTVLTFQDCATTGVTAGPAGASQNWDFSALVSLGTTYTEQMVTPASTTHGNLFPTATLVEKYSNGTFVYAHSGADSSLLVGYVDTTNNSVMTYANPMLFALRPVSYGIQVSDGFSVTYASTGYNFKGSGTATIHADAYGTLILPDGAHTNVLRLKVNQNQTDTLIPSGSLSITNTVSYVWFDGVHTSGLLKIDSTHAGTYVKKTVSYLLSEVDGIADVRGKEKFELYPNPASDRVIITVPEPGDCVITDMHGHAVSKFIIEAGQNSLSTRNLQPGIYSLTVRTNQGLSSSKLVITR